MLALVACLGARGVSAKALIESGFDEPDPAFMRAHVAQMEAQPFDGVVYHVGPDRGGDARGLSGAFTWQAWGTRRWTDADLAADLRDLQAIRWTRFRHNFLRVNVTPGVDWYDDNSAVLANLTLAASVAKRAGSRGVCLDTETYDRWLFSYPRQKLRSRRSFADYQAQVRRRGAEVMRALEQGYPGLTVFLTLTGTWADIERRGDRIPFATGKYGLLPAFVDGMVSAASPQAKIVDGMEASYPVRKPSDLDSYFDAHEIILSTASDRAKYRRTVSRAIAIWLDFDSSHRPWRSDRMDANYRSPEALRETLADALDRADDYVWIYSEKPRWWTASGRRQDLPTPYVDAIRAAREGRVP